MTATEFPDWFTAYAKPNFEKHLIPLAGVDNLHFLQLGVYTGDASLWLIDNVLTGQASELRDVDTWEGSDEVAHESLNFSEVYEYYLQRTSHIPTDKLINYRSTTTEYLITASDWPSMYDFIYIDADHTTVGVLLDAELSWPLLKSGGIMAFDDYTWGEHLPPHKRPKLGIDLFIERHQGQFETLAVGSQLWIKKL